MSLASVAAGELAAVVTYLEMTERPTIEIPSSPLRLEPIGQPSLTAYRALFRQVGSPWLWFSRLAMDDPKLAAIIGGPKVELYLVSDEQGADAGMVDLDFRKPAECELAFVGLVPELSGQGHGRWLLAEAVSRAWRDGIVRVHVHTCSLDHPAALPAYRRAGFLPYKRAVECFPDPRLSGILQRDCAPHIPLIAKSR